VKKRKMIRSAAVVCLFALSVFSPLSLQAEEAVEERRTIEVEGIVSEVDPVASLIVVGIMDEAGNSQEARLRVPDSIRIIQGTEDVRLNDINIGDPVTVRYYRDPSGELVAAEIVDNNLGNNQM